MFKRTTTALIFIVGLLTIIAWNMPENDEWKEKVSPILLEKAQQGEKVDFLVVLYEKADVSAAKNFKTKNEKAWYVYNQLKQTAANSQQNIINFLQTERVRYKPFYIINSIYVFGDLGLIKTLAERSDVAKIQYNPKAKVEEPQDEDLTNSRGPDAIEWGIDMINADDVWAMGYTGQNVVVAGADTGYEWFHPALQPKYRGWDGTDADHNYNWHDAIHEFSPLGDSMNVCGLSSPVPCDDFSHGTHTMGTMIGGEGENEIGVAPGAKWIACRNMEDGNGALTTYIECYEWFLAPTDLDDENADPAKSPHVINNSWYCSEGEGCNIDNWSLLEDAVNNLKTSGIVVVVSAGNFGGGGCETVRSPPAIFESSFSIGSTRSNDTLSGFSSRGPVTVDSTNRMKPEVAAPGSNVRSSILNGEYGNKSGTSMAGPHAAGLVALIISANPELAGQVDLIEEIIMQTAVPKTSDEECGGVAGTEVPNNSYGFGRIDALAAVELALITTSTEVVNSNFFIKTYPNPTQESITFELQNLDGKNTLEIFNVSGQRIIFRQFEANGEYIENVSLNELPDGIYFYKITNGENIFDGKLVKN
jgi:serine protease AprX